MKTIYLHIGNFKTGTSAIQKYCHDRREELLSQGVDYLQSARPMLNHTNHGNLSLSLCKKHGTKVPEWHQDPDDFDTVCSVLFKEIEQSSCNKIIISSEEFYRIPGLTGKSARCAMADLQTAFYGYEVRVLMYTREPLDMLKSWYNEVNKPESARRRFIDFFYHLNESILIPQANAAFWRECFGKDSLRVIPYKLKGLEHIQSFLTVIDESLVAQPDREDVRVNRKRDEKTLERDRINRIMALDKKGKREKFLRTSAYLSADNFDELMEKIELVERQYQQFCLDEGLPTPISHFSLKNLLIHEETINRNDVISMYFLEQTKAHVFFSRFTRLWAKIRSVMDR